MQANYRVALAASICLTQVACGLLHESTVRLPGAGMSAAEESWFCLANDAWDGWNCARDPRHALLALPARPPASPPPGSLPDRTAAVAGVDGPVSPLTVTGTQAAAVGADPVPHTDAAGSPPAPVTSGLAPAGATPAAQRAEAPGAAGAEPDWRHLAYQPATVTPLNELPGRFYAVQVVALSSEQALEEFRVMHRLSGVIGARVESGGRVYHALLLGIYENLADARAAAASRPASLQDTQPWIRTVATLQAAVVRAGRLAGHPDHT